jgi:hypothetical protein
VVEVESYVLVKLFHEARVIVPQPVVEVESYVLIQLFHERRLSVQVVEWDFEGVISALFEDPIIAAQVTMHRHVPIQTVDAMDVGAAFRSLFRDVPLRRSSRLEAKPRVNYSGMC